MRVHEIAAEGARAVTQAREDWSPDLTVVTTIASKRAGVLLASLRSVLDGTQGNVECVIVDDGSEAGKEPAVLEATRRDGRVLHLRYERGCGLAALRTNEGILRARGRAIAILPEGEALWPDFLARAWSALQEGKADAVHAGGTDAALHPLGVSGAVVARRAFFERFGLFDPHVAMRDLHGRELWQRALRLGARLHGLGPETRQDGGTTLPVANGIGGLVTLAYAQDARDYADRARRLRADAVLEQNVFDPARITPYVRDEGEWNGVADAIYRPALALLPASFDPLLLSNRAAAVDPAAGWNPAWALHRRRFRALVLEDARPGLAAVLADAARAVSGAIVLSLPGHALNEIEPGSLDVILGDGGGSQAGLARHRAAGARHLSIQAGGGSSREEGWSEGFLSPPDLAVDLGAPKRGSPLLGPPARLPPLATADRRARPVDRRPGEDLTALVAASPESEIAVTRAELDVLPPAAALELALLAASRDVDLVVAGDTRPTASAEDRAAGAADWTAWFANLLRVLRVRDRLGVAPGRMLKLDVYVNSELFAGSEVYGLRFAKLLALLGFRTRVLIPERNIYGEPAAINAWLTAHGLAPTIRAPFLPSMLHEWWRPAAEREPAIARLAAFVEADRPDLILATGHNPQLAAVPGLPPLFMAFFSAAAYEQTWLRDLHGRLHGIMSDTAWALRPTAAVLGAPARVIPSPVLGLGGSEARRVADDPGRWPVRIAIAGTFILRKRQLEAVKAVAALRRRGYDVELHLYGPELDITKDYIALVDAAIAAEGLSRHVVRHGFVEDEAEITRGNDVILCASTDESLPQGLVFQMHQGLLGVSVLCGGVDEIVVDGRTGYIARDPNPDGLADTLTRALDDRAAWPGIIREARRLIEERCGPGAAVASLLDLFDEGLALHQPGHSERERRARAEEEARRAAEKVARLARVGRRTRVRDVIGDDARVTTRSAPDWQPDITIVTPTYRRNAEGLLLRCLQSGLNQTFRNFEFVIVDDGSTDGTEDVVLALCEQDERIVYVRHDRNSGLPAVRTNEGIMRARGRAVAFLFDDNVLELDFLEQAWRLMQESKADIVHGDVDIPTASGKRYVLGGGPLTLDLIRVMNSIANGGVLIRREFFDRFGLYDPHLVARRLCDWELWNRALWLGARFRHLPRRVAIEEGMVSKNSLGSTVAIDWTTTYAYLQDTTTYEERARRLTPAAILDEDVLDAATLRRYVRNEAEWRSVVEQVYRPYLARHGLHYDQSLLSNRAASTDAASGWNPDWAIGKSRFRVAFLALAMPSLMAAMIEAIREIPGALVLNFPDFHLSLFEPGSLDIVFVVDGANAALAPVLEAHRNARTQVVYLSVHGEAEGDALFDLGSMARDAYIVGNFGEGAYFSQTGYRHDLAQGEAAKVLRAAADYHLAPDGMADLCLPIWPAPSLICDDALRRNAERPRIAYRLRDPRSAADVVEIVRRYETEGPGRISTESLASLVISRPETVILVEPSDLAALQLADQLGLGLLATRQGVSIVPLQDDDTGGTGSREIAAAWNGWFANFTRMLRLRAALGTTAHLPIKADIYLDSELLSGSEAYGLGIARLLAELGVVARVKVPGGNLCGDDEIAADEWLASNKLPPTTPAPYLPSAAWLHLDGEEKVASVDALEAYIAADPPDIIIAAAYTPHLAAVARRPPLVMALFSPVAYDQKELRALGGQVDGIVSDTAWALEPSARVTGAPGRVVRSAVFSPGRTQSARILERDPALPIRIAVAGTLQIRKRQLEAVRAVRQLRDAGFDVELNLYGYALEMLGDYVAALDSAIAEAGLEDRVRRQGLVEDPAQITRDNEIVLSASVDESLPQGLLFQMHEGLVGVAVLSGGIDEILRDGETGYVTDDPTPEGIAVALARAILDRDRWAAVTEAAYRVITEECGPPAVTARLLDQLLESVTLASVDRNLAAQRRIGRLAAEPDGAPGVPFTAGDASTLIAPEASTELHAVPASSAASRAGTVAIPGERSTLSRLRDGDLVFRANADGVCGAVLIVEAYAQLTASLASTMRLDLPLRYATATADASGVACLRWPSIPGGVRHKFALRVQIQVGDVQLRPQLRELLYAPVEAVVAD